MYAKSLCIIVLMNCEEDCSNHFKAFTCCRFQSDCLKPSKAYISSKACTINDFCDRIAPRTPLLPNDRTPDISCREENSSRHPKAFVSYKVLA